MRLRLLASTLGLSLIGQAAFAASPDACRLLTPTEVGAAVGATMAQGASVNGPTSSSCTWLQQGVEKMKAVTVILTVKSLAAYDTGKRALTPTPVSGVGDEAYQTGNSLSYTALSAKKGANAVTVSIRGLKDVAAVQAAEKTVAKAAVGKL